jgi:hypothetical protein
LLSGIPLSAGAAPEATSPPPVGADVFSVIQQDTNGDGRPDMTIIDAAFITQHDRVTVYDGGHNMRSSDRWWEATDFTDDTWAFDSGAEGSAQLIIQFRIENGHTIASVWDDANGDGKVKYEVAKGLPWVTELPFPTLTVEADGDWLLPNGSLNPVFTWSLDGCSACAMIPESARETLKPRLRMAGRISWAAPSTRTMTGFRIPCMRTCSPVFLQATNSSAAWSRATRSVCARIDRQRRYLTGQSTESPESLYSAIGAGLRGEVSMQPASQPYLYFSPIDARLRLSGATRGLYNVDDHQHVSYRSLAGDGHIEFWQLYDGDQPVAQLVQRPGVLVYATDVRVTLLKADVPAESFRMLPPTNHDAWAALGQQLGANSQAFAGDDLGAMFGQFAGERLTLSGGVMSNLQMTETGFRFVFDLQPGYDLGNFPVSGIDGPGRFLLDYDAGAGRFTARLSSPATRSSKASPPTGRLPRCSRFTSVAINPANSGLEDTGTMPLIVAATRPDGSSR